MTYGVLVVRLHNAKSYWPGDLSPLGSSAPVVLFHAVRKLRSSRSGAWETRGIRVIYYAKVREGVLFMLKIGGKLQGTISGIKHPLARKRNARCW